jgi:pimeloyl-ACP methyl ester carboxylesterase
MSKGAVRTVLLVHGAYADGSCWRRVIPLLEAAGYVAVAVQNPLLSLDEDVEALKRALDNAEGPVLLVAHSWGGAVITEAGDDPRVAGLVYVAAGAPDAGQSFAEMGRDYPSESGRANVRQTDPAGFVSLSRDGMVRYFAPDLPESETRVMAASQVPIAASAFATKLTSAAWKAKPSWYVIAGADKMISPDLQRALVKRIGATSITLPTSHVPMLSKPAEVAAFVVEAARAAGR